MAHADCWSLCIYQSKVDQVKRRTDSNGDWQHLGLRLTAKPVTGWEDSELLFRQTARVAISSIKSDVALMPGYGCMNNETVSHWVQMDPTFTACGARQVWKPASLSGDGHCVAAGARQKTINSKLLAGQVRAFQLRAAAGAGAAGAGTAPPPPCTCCEKMAIDYGFTTRGLRPQ